MFAMDDVTETAGPPVARFASLTWEFHDSYQATLKSHPKYDEIMKVLIIYIFFFFSNICL